MSTVCGATGRSEFRPIPALSAHPAAAAEQKEVFSQGPSALNKEDDSAGLQYLLQVPVSLCFDHILSKNQEEGQQGSYHGRSLVQTT